MEKIYNCLQLESYNLKINLPLTKMEVEKILKEHGVPFRVSTDSSQIVVTSKILSLSYDFCINFQFIGEKLNTLIISPVDYKENKALYSRYKEIQKKLEKEIGVTCNILYYIGNWLNPRGSIFRWNKGNIEVKHYIFEHFVMEEHIQIKYK